MFQSFNSRQTLQFLVLFESTEKNRSHRFPPGQESKYRDKIKKINKKKKQDKKIMILKKIKKI